MISTALLLAPALGLALLLLLGRYPGETRLRRALERVRERLRPVRSTGGPRRCQRRAPSGARLLGRGLAGRAPPPARSRTRPVLPS